MIQMGTDIQKNNSKLEQVYLQNYNKMYYVAKKMLQSKEKAEDAVHDSFFHLAKNFERYEKLDENKMEALCITITKNKSIDIIRKEKKLSEEDMEAVFLFRGDDHAMIEEIVERKEVSKIVVQAIEQLPEVLKMVIQLKYYQGYQNREIARILDVSVKTVHMRMYRAKRKLEELLEAQREGIQEIMEEIK